MILEETLYGIRNLVNDQEGQIETLQKLNEGLAKKLEETYKEVEQLKAKLAEAEHHHADYHAICSARNDTCPQEAEVERLRAALAKCVLKRRGDAPDFPEGYRGANVPDEDFIQYVERADAVARVALRGGEEHSKHPTGDYCVYCLSQWPCVEAGEQ